MNVILRSRSYHRLRIVLLLGLFSLVGGIVWATQEGKNSEIHNKPVKLGVDLVTLNVTVLTTEGGIVTSLGKNSFEVYEDKVKQQITHFSREDTPVSLGIIFDLSGSMKGKSRDARRALEKSLELCREDDEIFIIGFNHRVNLLRDFTSNDSEIFNSVSLVKPEGHTALIDAIYMGMEKLKQSRYSRRALLIISDGQDNSSRYTSKELKQLVKESDVVIYSIATANLYGDMTELDYGGLELLERISEASGGRAYSPQGEQQLNLVCAHVALQLHRQYSIAYVSTNSERDGRWRRLKVKVRGPEKLGPLVVQARNGYYAYPE